MSDLYLAGILVGLISAVAVAAGIGTARRVSRRSGAMICLLFVGFLVTHVLLISDRLWVTRLVPVAGVPILGNGLLAVAGAFLAGCAWRLMPGGVLRRGVLLLPLLGLCAHRTLAPAIARAAAAPLVDRWRDGVCVQSTPATCSAAAAATLLRAHGIAATESEMADLCRTTDRGTSNHGLYRGLKLKTAGTGWTVESFRTSADGLRSRSPAILNVRLELTPGLDPRYEKLWGWTPGVSHTVVCFRFVDGSGGRLEMGDPSVGREYWSTRDLHVLWRGEGFRLVRR